MYNTDIYIYIYILPLAVYFKLYIQFTKLNFWHHSARFCQAVIELLLLSLSRTCNGCVNVIHETVCITSKQKKNAFSFCFFLILQHEHQDSSTLLLFVCLAAVFACTLFRMQFRVISHTKGKADILLKRYFESSY